ncbi:MAG: tetratricopeptide repeat protein, partial [Candidatus Tectomicrobia bacterium]|nr:tetratricopeptide repeat protein [Candidatus Tectomicrobia bacterium]
AYNMLGYALRKTGDPKEALEAYNRALALKPDYAPALEYRGEAHLMLKDRKAAVEDYQALVKLGSPLARDLKGKIDSAPAN